MPRSPAFLSAGFSFLVRRDSRAPKPPASFNVLSDWDPAYSLYADRVAPISYAPVGTAPTREKVDGIWCGVFGGAGALVGSGAPFAALADLTGGVSIYVVAERTDDGTGQDGLVWFDDDDGTTSNANQLGITWNGPGTGATMYAYDGAAGASFDSGSSIIALNTVEFVSGHATTTARTIRASGVGTAEASGTTRDPGSLTRVLIGANALFSATQGSYFTGRYRRKLTCEGPYNAAVLAYLQALYQA